MESKKYDVVALGELLIDFTDSGISPQGNPVMEANPGGAPCNVLAILTRLGHKTGFIGKVGEDIFGSQLKQALTEVGISTEGLVFDKDIRTTLAFVKNHADGDREFSFYRNPGADMMLKTSDINKSMIDSTKIFHLGSLSLTDEPVREATINAVRMAKEAGAVISYDPNLRELLWRSLDEAKVQIAFGMEHCNMLKISDNEITWYTGLADYEAGVRFLQEKYPNIDLILVSLGKEGSMAFSRTSKIVVPAFARDNAVDTTGAGDTFCGSVLHYLLENNCIDGKIKDLKENELKEMLTFANAAASLITTKKGALRVMPYMEEIRELITIKN